jgi:tellurite resistance protein
MVDHDAFQDRGRSLEEEYFRKKNRELIEKMQLQERSEQALRDMGAQVGSDDPETLRELQKLGFTPETVALLPLVPVVQVAWADGNVATAERDAIRTLARTRGITDGSAAFHQLDAWLADRPAPEVFSGATRLIRAILDAPAAEERRPGVPVDREQKHLSADELVAYCESIANASGGLFGVRRISPEERAILTSIASQLKKT